MESTLKRYFWAIHLVLLVGIAGVLALAAGNVFNGLLSPLAVVSPPPPQKVDSSPAAQDARLASTDKDKWGKPKEPEPPPVDEKPAEEEEVEPEVTPEGEYPVSDLPVTLTGTMVAGDPRWSMALMVDTSSRASFMASEGEAILEEGVKVIKIERDRVLVEREGRLEQIELEGDGAPKAGAGARRSSLARPPSRSVTGARPTTPTPTVSKPEVSSPKNDQFADLRKGIEKVNESSFKVSRQTLTDALANPGKFRDGTRPIPNYKGGKVNGFKLVGMKPGSLYYDLGIRPGDIITSVNGKPLDSPNRALELYQQLNNLDKVVLGVERNGQDRSLTFSIK